MDLFDNFAASLDGSDISSNFFDDGLSMWAPSNKLEDLLLLDSMVPRRQGVLVDTFNLFNYEASFVKKYFRFHTAEDVVHMADMFGMPATMRATNGTKASGLDVLCIVLRRLAYPCRYVDLCATFPYTETELCLLFNIGVDHIYSRFHTKLSNLNQPWLSIPSLQRYAAAVAARGAPLQNCWGFIDGTVRPICRPTMHQREVYNGHKRQHGIKFQSIMVPNGLVANLFGPMEGRRHDAALLNESGVLNFIEQNFNVNGNPLCLYGDPAYPLRPHLMRPYRGGHLTPEQQAFNTDMASVRQAVEWGFGKIISEWAFLDHKKNLKLFLSPVGKLYLTGAFLANCHTCMYGSSVSQFFGMDPPTVEEYTSV